MASLTTLFVVGPDEYVEFSESMGSKAFLEHIWDQEKTPLKIEETSAFGTQLHSAGARLSSTPPPRIEFPTVVRVRGQGNRYRLSGRYVSWEELKRRNPTAVKDPPSLDDFINRGSIVGTAERLEPGSFLKGEKRFKIRKKPQIPEMSLHKDSDGWIGGSSDSVYANKGSMDSIYAVKPTVEVGDGVASGKGDTLVAPVHKTLRKSRSGLSLSERLGIDKSQEEPMPSLSSNNAFTHKPTATPNALLPVKNVPPPLSASCTPPETPLKGSNAKSHQPVITPTESLSPKVASDLHLPSSGLQLDPAPAFASGMRASASTPRAARSQIDDMLKKVRQARVPTGSAGGSSESMWAPKKEEINVAPVENLGAKTGGSKTSVPTSNQPKRDGNKAEARSVAIKTEDAGKSSLLSRLGPPLTEPVESKKIDVQGMDDAEKLNILQEKPAKSSKKKSQPLAAQTAAKKTAERVYEDIPQATAKADTTAKSESQEGSEDIPAHLDSALSIAIPAAPQPPPAQPMSDNLQTSSDSKHSEIDAWSTIGNETITSIDWADLDDDDDSPLDVPDDWGYSDTTSATYSAPNTAVPLEPRSEKNQGSQSRAFEPPRQPKGMRDAGRRLGGGVGQDKGDDSALPYWQRRSATQTGTPTHEHRSSSSARGGLKIAGAANVGSQNKNAKSKRDHNHVTGQVPRKELFPQQQPRQASSTGQHGHKVQPASQRDGRQKIVLPPNATPLAVNVEKHNEKLHTDRSRGSAKKPEPAFERMTKGAIGLGGKAAGTQSKDLLSRIDLSRDTDKAGAAQASAQSAKKPTGHHKDKNPRGNRRPSQA